MRACSLDGLVVSGPADWDAPDWLRRWICSAPPGRALDAGAGGGWASAWLARVGFDVDSLEPDRRYWKAVARLKQKYPIKLIRSDIETAELTADHYSLVLASSLLHLLPASSLESVCAKLTRVLAPGGVIMAEVFTVDDPGADMVEHAFAPGELQARFDALESLFYDESRRAAPDRAAGYVSGATLIARKPLLYNVRHDG